MMQIKLKKLQISVSQFFKAYYEQNQTQIDYFLVDGADIKGAGQKFSFNKIDRINIYKLSEKNLGNCRLKCRFLWKCNKARI